MFATRKMMMGGGGPYKFKLVGYSTATASSTGSITGALPGKSRPGDVIVAVGVAGGITGSALLNLPTGWTNKGGLAGSGLGSLRMMTRTMVAGDSSFTFTMSAGTPTGIVLILLVYRKAVESANLQAAAGSINGNGTVTSGATGVSGTGTLIQAVASGGGTSSAASHSTPTGMALLTSSAAASGAKLSIFTQDGVSGSSTVRSSTIAGSGTSVSIILPHLIFEV